MHKICRSMVTSSANHLIRQVTYNEHYHIAKWLVEKFNLTSDDLTDKPTIDWGSPVDTGDIEMDSDYDSALKLANECENQELFNYYLSYSDI